MSTCERLASAVSLDAELAVLLRRPCTAHVHSVSRQVVDLVLDNGRLISLRTAESDDAPWSVRVAVPEWEAWMIQSGDLVNLDADGIRLPSGDISLVCAAPWAPAPPQSWYPGIDHAVALQRHLRSVRTDDPFARTVAHRVAVLTGQLAHAEETPDAGAVRAAVEGLLGLGTGPTPTGDDVLTGILLIAARPGSRIVLTPRAVLTALADDPSCTTAVSAATLGEATRGRAPQSVLDLIHDLAAAVPEPRVAAVLGRTSGADLVAGLAAGIHLEQRLRGMS